VRTAHVIPPRFSRHLHLRPCIEVAHDGKKYCADIACAFIPPECRRQARLARESGDADMRAACVEDAPRVAVRAVVGGSRLARKVLSGGVLGSEPLTPRPLV
jgi:hypothetical protein